MLAYHTIAIVQRHVDIIVRGDVVGGQESKENSVSRTYRKRTTLGAGSSRDGTPAGSVVKDYMRNAV
jgi:hypothetical protein